MLSKPRREPETNKKRNSTPFCFWAEAIRVIFCSSCQALRSQVRSFEPSIYGRLQHKQCRFTSASKRCVRLDQRIASTLPLDVDYGALGGTTSAPSRSSTPLPVVFVLLVLVIPSSFCSPSITMWMACSRSVLSMWLR